MDRSAHDAMADLVNAICCPLIGRADDSTLTVSPAPAVEYGLRKASLTADGTGIALRFDPDVSKLDEILLIGSDIEALLEGSADAATRRKVHKTVMSTALEYLMTATVREQLTLNFDEM